MIAEIKADGCLVIRPETELEAYALEKWNVANRGDDEPAHPIKRSTMKVDPSLPVEVLQ